jgi:aspartokinase
MRIKSRATHGNDKHIEISDTISERITYDRHIAHLQIKLAGKSDGGIVEILRALAGSKVSLDMVVIEPGEMRFTADGGTVKDTCAILRQIGYHAKVVPQCVKIYVQSSAISENTKLIAVATRALTDRNIPILQISGGYGAVAILIEEKNLDVALDILARQCPYQFQFCGNLQDYFLHERRL